MLQKTDIQLTWALELIGSSRKGHVSIGILESPEDRTTPLLWESNVQPTPRLSQETSASVCGPVGISLQRTQWPRLLAEGEGGAHDCSYDVHKLHQALAPVHYIIIYMTKPRVNFCIHEFMPPKYQRRWKLNKFHNMMLIFFFCLGPREIFYLHSHFPQKSHTQKLIINRWCVYWHHYF